MDLRGIHPVEMPKEDGVYLIKVRARGGRTVLGSAFYIGNLGNFVNFKLRDGKIFEGEVDLPVVAWRKLF